jgi:hypothetical protein
MTWRFRIDVHSKKNNSWRSAATGSTRTFVVTRIVFGAGATNAGNKEIMRGFKQTSRRKAYIVVAGYLTTTALCRKPMVFQERYLGC